MKDKLKNVEIKYFLLPSVILLLTFVLITNIMVTIRVKERKNIFENKALSIAETYINAFNFSRETYDTLNEVIDEKLMLTAKMLSMIAFEENYLALTHLSRDLHIDEISVYNSDGKIIYSNITEYIGWEAYEGHPVHDFMRNGQDFHIEDIRQDTISGAYMKYAYVRNPDDTFIQFGESAHKIETLLRKVDYQKLISIMSQDRNILEVTLVDNNYTVLASSIDQMEGQIVKETFYSNNEHVFTHTAKEITGIIPVYHYRERHGTLIIKWTTAEIARDIRRVVLNGSLQLLIMFLIMIIIFYYAYRKNKSNIKSAFYDKLTGLPNNDYLTEYLQELINDSDKKKAVMLVNIKNFKNLNLTYGFLFINNMLAQFAERINILLSPGQKLFRIGIDRFIIVAQGYSNKDELVILSEKIILSLSSPFESMQESRQISPEIGIVEVRSENMTVERVLQDVMLALSNIKDTMVFPVLFFEDIMEDVIRREDRIEKALRSVINGSSKNRFRLNYQPKLDLTTDKITGFEALARMHTDELGNITPVEFINIAEKRQLIYKLGMITFNQACCFIKTLIENGYKDIGIAVNISGLQLLRDEFLNDVSDIIRDCDIPARLLEFEVTESILLENYNLVNGKLKTLKKMGISVSIDDFGTGFSSLSRLRELNIDSIKMDRYFVNNVGKEDDSTLITADIISMAHRMGLKVVAEGVETEEQKEYLRKHNCDQIQGYLLGKPYECETALAILRKINNRNTDH